MGKLIITGLVLILVGAWGLYSGVQASKREQSLPPDQDPSGLIGKVGHGAKKGSQTVSRYITPIFLIGVGLLVLWSAFGL